jgi:hypothetical protein
MITVAVLSLISAYRDVVLWSRLLGEYDCIFSSILVAQIIDFKTHRRHTPSNISGLFRDNRVVLVRQRAHYTYSIIVKTTFRYVVRPSVS